MSMMSFIKETSNAWSASFRKGQRVLVLPYTSFLFFANQLGTSWHLCAHHIKLADGRIELLPDPCPPASEGKNSCLSRCIAIYSDTTYLFDFLVAVACVQVWLGNVCPWSDILLSGAEYLKEIELNEREIDLLGTCPLKIHVQLLPANIN